MDNSVSNQTDASTPSVILGDVSERLAPKLEQAQEQLQAVNSRLKGFIRAYPGATLLGVAGLGFIFGRLASRK